MAALRQFTDVHRDTLDRPLMVESRCGAVALGSVCLLPPLSSGGARVTWPSLRFHTPLIEPDVRSYRIRLSDKTSRLRPRPAVLQVDQTHEPEVPVQMLRWISPAPTSPDFVLDAQPPTQPRRGVAVERLICAAGGPHLEVVRPAAQRSVQLAHHLRGLLPYVFRSVSAWTFSTMRRILFFDGRMPKRALPVFGEYILPNVYPRKSNSPSGTLQIRVFSSLTVSLSLPMISRSRDSASSALPFLHKITRSSA